MDLPARVNIFIIQIEYTANENRQTLSQPKPYTECKYGGTTRSSPGTSHESEASEASVFCFDNASPEKSCFVDGLVCFISLCLRVFKFLNATRRK